MPDRPEKLISAVTLCSGYLSLIVEVHSGEKPEAVLYAFEKGRRIGSWMLNEDDLLKLGEISDFVKYMKADYLEMMEDD